MALQLIQPVTASKIKIWGILNVTPDSFSGNCFIDPEKAVAKALQMQADGADCIDVGGESTRPGAIPVSEQEEIDRVLPVLHALKKVLNIPFSIDTYKPKVMKLAVTAGARFINDIFALQQEGALAMAARLKTPICLMHMQKNPLTMQKRPHYENLIDEIIDFFNERIKAAVNAGISRGKIILDPGFGFGKTVQHNLQLIKSLHLLQQEFKLPLLIGVSRKSSIGKILGNIPVEQRLFGSLTLEILSILNGASILRTHDIKAVSDANKVIQAMSEQQERGKLIVMK